MKRMLLSVSFALAFAALAACLPLATPLPPLPTDTPLPPTETATPTIVWFPPTATRTPLPQSTLYITPTLDLSPRYGALLFQDDFSDPDAWTLGRLPNGSLALGENELTLVVSQAPAYIYSLRQGVTLDDFYVEVTASPGICRGADEYGLLLRVSPSLEFFRFALLCNGQVRVDRFFNGQASSPLPPTPNGAIPPGAPSASRIAVWAVGKQLRFYANGAFVFTLNDASLPSGGLGLFARAAGEDSVTINFSNLTVYQPLP